MQDALIATVARYAPAWVRYVLTVSEIGRSNEGWVLASGDNIAIMDAGGTSAMPLWPYRELAASASGAEDELAATEPPPEPTSIDALELVEKILPALIANEVSVATFPAPDDTRVIEARGVIRDLQVFIDEPRDVASELAAEAGTVEVEGWAPLSVPDLGPSDQEADASFWLLASEDEPSVIGVVIGGRPALALFATRPTAEEFAEAAGVPAMPRPASTDSLIGHWLLMAFTAAWDVALVTDDGSFGAVKPVRLALDLALASAQQAEKN